MEYCACGCGEVLDFSKGRKNKKFLQGHSARINNKGGESRKGIKPWNYGIPRTTEEKQKLSQTIKKGKENSTYKYTEKHKQRISDSLTGRTKDKEWIAKIKKSREENPDYEDCKKRISKTLKEKYKNGELISYFYIDGRYKNDPTSNFNLYGGEFTDELKTKIRLRDKYICQSCDKKRSTCVHHIDYNKLNNTENNLIVLCRVCHSKHHHKNNVLFLEEQLKFKNIVNKNYE